MFLLWDHLIGKIKITDDFEPHFETIPACCGIGKAVGSTVYPHVQLYIPEGEDPAQYKEEVFSRMKRMVDYAVEQDVVLLHENEKEIYGDIANRCLELMEAFLRRSF